MRKPLNMKKIRELYIINKGIALCVDIKIFREKLKLLGIQV
jgi:hypothetical protein